MSEKPQLWKDIDRVVLRASNHMANLVVNGVGAEPEGWSPTDEIWGEIVERLAMHDYYLHPRATVRIGIWSWDDLSPDDREKYRLSASRRYLGAEWPIPDRAGNGGTDANE